MRYFLPAFLCLATATLAHEFWLQPTSFRIVVGAKIPLKLLIGSNFKGETWPRPTRRVRRFVRFGPTNLADSTDLRPALLADSVAPALTCPAAGTHVVVLTSAPAFTELPADQFTAYLRAEGLDDALLYRRKEGQTTKPGREAYCRCAKTLVLATTSAHAPPSPADTTYRRVLNLPLELVPEQNPYYLRPGAALTVRVLHHGQPVPSALVQVWDATPQVAVKSGTIAAQPTHFSTRANNSGRVLLRVPGGGPYLVAVSLMEAAPAGLASRADWLSTWATLTFAGPGAAGVTNSQLFSK
jgi:uncharacterized GH25 family protein